MSSLGSVNRRDFLKNSVKVASLSAIAGAGLGEFVPAQAANSDITHGSRSKPQIALTFHGAGDPAIDKGLLDLFAKTGTPITVFAIGAWLKSNPTMAKKIIDAGHDIGNHTMNHYQMKTLSAKKVDSEIAGCAKELKTLIGNLGSWFRPSGTQYATPLIRQTAFKYGYKQCISYDVDSKDYTDPGAAAIIANTMASLKNGSIVSLHFGHAGTLKAMPTLLTKIHDKGFTPVTLTTLLGKL